MKHRSLLFALVCCFSLLASAAVSSLHAADPPKKKKKSSSDETAAVHHRKSTKSAAHHGAPHAAPSRPASSKQAATTRHRVIPATTTAEDEETAPPVDLGPVDPTRPPVVAARSVVVINAQTGEILYEKDPDTPRPIASTTKLLTALLIAEAGNLNGQVEVQPIDTICEPTKLYFKPGERYARNALLYALLVHSCNDVARCLARDNAGSIPDFADKMNSRAAQLGARNTHFVNPNGLPSPGEDQHSTARDLSRIARAAYFNPVLRPIMATPHLLFQYADGRTREFANTNKVLVRYPFCTGMKTGYTDAAGHCLVSSAEDNGHAVISVALGDNKSIWNDSQKLLSWGLAASARGTSQHAPLNVPTLPASEVASTASRPAWTTPSKVN